MPGTKRLPKRIQRQIDKAVQRYIEKRISYERISRSIYNYLLDHEKLAGKFHSIRYRVKDPEHLRNKLERKALEARRRHGRFAIDENNVFSKIDDLAGVRVLHLHTNQIDEINGALKEIFKEMSHKILEGPMANTWDDEYRTIFKKFGIRTRPRDSMYTSVHYVIQAPDGLRCEVQVRTLMEEVWGEVSHTIDYPHPTESLPCREQIKVLARVTSGCTRLVDSIFLSHAEYGGVASARPRKSRPRRRRR